MKSSSFFFFINICQTIESWEIVLTSVVSSNITEKYCTSFIRFKTFSLINFNNLNQLVLVTDISGVGNGSFKMVFKTLSPELALNLNNLRKFHTFRSKISSFSRLFLPSSLPPRKAIFCRPIKITVQIIFKRFSVLCILLLFLCRYKSKITIL
jgi:hypothetical protein